MEENAMSTGMSWRSASAAILAVACAAGLAACGGGDNESSSTPANPTSAAATTATADIVAEAKANVAKLSEVPSDIGPTEPLNKPVMNKKVVAVECAVPICLESGKEFQRVGKKYFNWDVTVINAGATPQSVTQAFNTAVALKPDAVADGAIPTVAWTKQLKQLAAAGVPIVTGGTSGGPTDGIVAQYYGERAGGENGASMADWVISDSDGTGKAVYVDTPELLGLKPIEVGFTKRMKQCTGCSTDTINVKLADIGRVVPGRVVSYLQSHPNVGYVVGINGDTIAALPQALKSAGLADRVKVLSEAGTPLTWQYLKDGQQDADLSTFLQVFRWQQVDALARGMTGQKQEFQPSLPQVWVTSDTIAFDPKAGPKFGVDFQAEFEKLWKGGQGN
jgi:ABC-type sugar transport system substrate-binding protein